MLPHVVEIIPALVALRALPIFDLRKERIA